MTKPEELKEEFLQLAEKMVEVYGVQTVILLLTENFLDEMEPGRHDGLIDIPVR